MSTLRLVEAAASFAEKAHGTQKYGDRPYIEHLVDVHCLVKAYAPEDMELRQAAYLHDVLEDTPVGFQEISQTFGSRVANLVLSVTSKGTGSRVTRNPVTYKAIAAAGPDAILLKLCDRTANVQNCWLSMNPPLLYMYYQEYPGFRTALRPLSTEREAPLWQRLDHLMGRKEKQ